MGKRWEFKTFLCTTENRGEWQAHGLLPHVTYTQPGRGVDMTIIGSSPETNTTQITKMKGEKTKKFYLRANILCKQ